MQELSSWLHTTLFCLLLWVASDSTDTPESADAVSIPVRHYELEGKLAKRTADRRESCLVVLLCSTWGWGSFRAYIRLDVLSFFTTAVGCEVCEVIRHFEPDIKTKLYSTCIADKSVWHPGDDEREVHNPTSSTVLHSTTEIGCVRINAPCRT